MRLVGHQVACATPYQARTGDAAVCFQVGSTMLYLHDSSTVRLLQSIWMEHRPRIKALPYIASRGLIPVSGHTNEPGVILHARSEPPASSILVPGRGDKADPYFRFQFDRIAFEVRDQAAYATTSLAVDRAAQLAQHTFLDPVTLPAPRIGLHLA